MQCKITLCVCLRVERVSVCEYFVCVCVWGEGGIYKHVCVCARERIGDREQ